MTRAGRTAAVAVALLVLITVSGCVSLFLPNKAGTVSTPTGETVAGNLQSFYSQVLTWSPCETDRQCSIASAPLDWANPGRGTVDLALIRSTSTSGSRLGSLLVNPGGPGGSGYNFIRDSLDYAVSAKLRERYDIVGFDPRGVNKSSAVTCYTAPKELDAVLFDIPKAPFGTPEYIAELEASSAAFGKACLDRTGDLLGFVDTVSAARDLDLLRAILGDAKLNYLGYSYGTLLGATFADLYPDKTGRLVFDGAVDPSTTEFQVTTTQAQGFESALRAYLADCKTGTACPFTGTVEASATTIRALLDSLDASPIRATDGRQLCSATMFTAIILPLYSVDNWMYLTELFTKVLAGDADYAFLLADSYYSRDKNGTYTDNSTEAFIAINCLDYAPTTDAATIEAQAAELRRLAPVFGPSMSYGGTSCASWPFASTRERAPIAAKGSGPILVVGTTNDPATPYVWAKSLAGQLENGHLVTYKGEGHTAYNKSNSCVNDAVDGYFLNGTVPTADPNC